MNSSDGLPRQQYGLSIRTLCANILSRKDGATAVEFALVAPILFLMIFGIIEFVLVVSAASLLEGATISAAREGSTGYCPTGQTQASYIESLIQNRVSPLLDPTQLVFTIPPASDTPGATVGYTVTYPWPVQIPMIQSLLGINGIFTITSTAVVQNEPHQ